MRINVKIQTLNANFEKIKIKKFEYSKIEKSSKETYQSEINIYQLHFMFEIQKILNTCQSIVIFQNRK